MEVVAATAARKVALEDLYSVEEELGRGGGAIVYRVKRKSDGKLFALKTIRVTSYRSKREMRDETLPEGGLLRQAQAEINALQRLQASGAGGDQASDKKKKKKKKKNRSGVVELVEVIEEKDYYHLVLELCETSLRDLLLKRKRLTEHEAAHIIKKLAKTVRKMHKAGVMHRDMKTPNVLLGFDHSVKLADFGTSYIELERDKPRMVVRSGDVGTERYVAPEVCYSPLDYDEKIDIWGLGIVLYEMLAGKLAFASVASRDVQGRLKQYEDLPMSSLDFTNVTNGAKSLILGMLNIDPRKRISLQMVEKHPWVVEHCLEHKQAEKENRKRKRDVDIENQAQVNEEAGGSRKIRLRCVNGAWQSVQSKAAAEEAKEITVPKIKLRLVNGAWQTAH